jgi:hypothetical protein
MTLTTIREEALCVSHHEAHRHKGLMDQVDELVDDEGLNFIPPVKYARDEFMDGSGILVFDFIFEEHPKHLYLKSL